MQSRREEKRLHVGETQTSHMPAGFDKSKVLVSQRKQTSEVGERCSPAVSLLTAAVHWPTESLAWFAGRVGILASLFC